ncbi:Ger(x)C family spore germination protein [Brevibacillus sp. H7]|uniref:Ger(x)C family spore germination protein n=1 Tax=Brevibacillus sp. H7 TaxID=3349138 RepID=UPI003803685E
MKRRIQAILLLVLILTGCAPEIETPALEDMGLVGIIGFDYLDGKQMKVTVSVPLPELKTTKKTQFFTTVSRLPSESLISLSTKSDRTMQFSQLRVVLINEELARKSGIHKIVRDLSRNPIVGDNVYIAVVKGTAEEIITSEYKSMPEINTYLNNLLRPRRETSFGPFTTMHDFMYTSTNQVCDPSLPYLEKTDGELQLTKVASFKGDKLIGFLSEREGILVQAILGRNNLPKMPFEVEEESNKKATVVVDFVRARSEVESFGDLSKPTIRIKISTEGPILGYTGSRDLENPREINEVRRQIEQELIKEIHALLQKFQKKGIDPAALEESLRTRYRGKWKREMGLSALKKATFQVSVDIDFTGYGTMK